MGRGFVVNSGVLRVFETINTQSEKDEFKEAYEYVEALYKNKFSDVAPIRFLQPAYITAYDFPESIIQSAKTISSKAPSNCVS